MKELEKKETKDLAVLLKEKREALRTFRFGVAGSKVRNMKEGRLLRQEIARILTVINARKDK